MSFLETPRFPTDISFGSKGGPEYSTTVVKTTGGYEKRNSNWTYPLHKYDVSYGVKTNALYYALLKHFHAVAGKAHGFRYKDSADYKSCAPADTPASTDVLIGTGDASTTTFQLVKLYTSGSLTKTRKIAKPVALTVLVSLNGVTQGSGWSVDTATGIVTFVSPPGNGVLVKAGYEFDVPVRFDIDHLDLEGDAMAASGELIMSTAVPLVELRL
jgi:uncharacterized protein (TIGR02217 family)